MKREKPFTQNALLWLLSSNSVLLTESKTSITQGDNKFLFWHSTGVWQAKSCLLFCRYGSASANSKNLTNSDFDSNKF